MVITTKELRVQPGKIISQVNNGLDVTITYRGKPSAKIVPINKEKSINVKNTEDLLFGIWKDKNDITDVDQYVRNMRKGRKL
ncbi:MAG: type II toxin-antitoxin system prevent-host-death family antitoxin [Treponema sp.]|nr:type II toxin-antitoxin system prevent-host-death family antitoxin [Treponema sp.]